MNNLGFRVYGIAALLLGAVGLAWDDFALVWQPVPEGLPGRSELAYLTGVALVVGGIVLNWRAAARRGALVLAALYACGVILLHAPHVVAHPFTLAPWAGVAEQTALVTGGVVSYAVTNVLVRAPALRLVVVARWIFGSCLLVFGAVHFAYTKATAEMVPAWLPPGQLFWAYLTGVAHIAAGLGILFNIQARMAAILLTIMFAGFGILVHLPLLLTDPTSHLNWVMNAMNLALTGSAWVVADSYTRFGQLRGGERVMHVVR